MKNILSTDESVERQITDSITENFTDSDLESIKFLNRGALTIFNADI